MGSVRRRVIKGIGIRRQGAAFCFVHLLGMSIRTSFAWDGYCDVICFDLVLFHLPLMVMVTIFFFFFLIIGNTRVVTWLWVYKYTLLSKLLVSA